MENPDMQLAVEFFSKPIEIPRKSKAEKRPIFEDREYIRIRFPADNKRELVAPAHEMHYVSHLKRQMTYAERFKPNYDAWRADHEAEFIEGTPLSEATFLTEAKRAELRAQNIKTIEQLAGLPTQAMRKLGMGAQGLVQSAQDYLERAKGLSEVDALKARIAELEAGQASKAEPKQDASEKVASELEGFGDDELKMMLKDAGVEVDGRWGRQRLEAEMQALAAAKENEAA